MQELCQEKYNDSKIIHFFFNNLAVNMEVEWFFSFVNIQKIGKSSNFLDFLVSISKFAVELYSGKLTALKLLWAYDIFNFQP